MLDVAPGSAGRTAAALRSLPLPPGAEVVPGASSVTVRYEQRDETAIVRSLLVQAIDAPPVDTTVRCHELTVRYDGADLDHVAAAVGLGVDEVVRRHHSVTYTVDFMGFAPGFAYLIGLDPVLALARRATPRPAVPAGSVAIASRFSAVYPAESPGGWHLIGRCETALFELERDPPALLGPGDQVRFVPS